MIESASRSDPLPKRSGYPLTSDAALDAARLRHSAHDNDAALASLDEGLRQFPDTWPLISLRAQIIGERDGSDGALRIVQAFADKHWWHFAAALTLARLHAQRGEMELAMREFERASRLDIHDADALNALAFLEAEQNHLDRACSIQACAAARQPHQSRQFLILAELLQKAGHTAEAREMFAQSQVAAN